MTENQTFIKKLRNNGQITVPEEIRLALKLETNDLVKISIERVNL